MGIMKSGKLALVALALTASPLSAQDEPDPLAGMDDALIAMQDAFAADPLTPEQEARLPLAAQAVASIIPDGTYERMMRETMGGAIENMIGALAGDTMSAIELATVTGVDADTLRELDRTSLAAISQTIDPNYRERTTQAVRYMTDELAKLYGEMEPGIRTGLSRAYAVRFTRAQLMDINAFFATETGAAYANESMMIFVDPQTMSSMMEGMPMLMERMPEIMNGMATATADLPAEKTFDTLTPAERARIAGALGLTVPDLQESMEAAQESMADLPIVLDDAMQDADRVEDTAE